MLPVIQKPLALPLPALAESSSCFLLGRCWLDSPLEVGLSFEWLDRFDLIFLEPAVDQVSGQATSLIQKLLNL